VGNNDVIIIGAGHNSLVAAGYLAKAGRRVVVLEKRSIVGGTAITEEVFPGFKISLCADTAGYLSGEVVADLKLDSQVEFIPLDPIASSPEPDGTHLTIWRDTAKTVKEIERFSSADAAKYPEFVKQMTKIAGVVEGLLKLTPMDLPTVSLADLRAALSLAGPVLKLGRKNINQLLRVLPTPVAQGRDRRERGEGCHLGPPGDWHDLHVPLQLGAQRYRTFPVGESRQGWNRPTHQGDGRDRARFRS
jgi:phytoene dehydrogenase-like protein